MQTFKRLTLYEDARHVLAGDGDLWDNETNGESELNFLNSSVFFALVSDFKSTTATVSKCRNSST